MKAIHIYIYNQVLSTTQRAHMVKQLHSSLRDSLPIGRRQSSHLKSSSCRCQSRMHLWSGTVNEMHKSYTITTQVWSCLLPLQCLSQIPQFHCFRLCSIHAVSMQSCLKASSVSKKLFGFHNCHNCLTTEKKQPSLLGESNSFIRPASSNMTCANGTCLKVHIASYSHIIIYI